MKIRLLEIRDADSFEKYEKYKELISRERQEKIGLLRRDADKTVSLFTELLIKEELALMTGERFEKIEIIKDSLGKPYAKDMEEIFFSVAHSQNRIVFATAKSPVGVDIEFMREVNLKTAQRFFTKEEYESVIAKDKREFFRIWTLKESYVKMLGKGFRIPPESFCVTSGEIAEISESAVYENYMISVCGGR